MRSRRRPRCRRPRVRGLTVIELMVVVAVAALLAALATPSLRGMLARQRVAAVNAELVTDLQYARSEAVARNREVYVSFRTAPREGSPPMSCYTVHTLGTVGTCDCRKPPGAACQNVEGLVEIKTVQVLASTEVSLLPPGGTGNRIGFVGAQGLASWLGNRPTDADYSTAWQDFTVGVESSISGKLRTTVGITGRPQVCSPDGSIAAVPRCPE